MVARLNFTPTCEHQALVVELWAEFEGRPRSGLLALLLELGLAKAEQEGMMPQCIVHVLRHRQED